MTTPRIKQVFPAWDEIGQGLGTEMHRLFRLLWIHPGKACKCVLIAQEMNQTPDDQRPAMRKQWSRQIAVHGVALVRRAVMKLLDALLWPVVSLFMFCAARAMIWLAERRLKE